MQLSLLFWILVVCTDAVIEIGSFFLCFCYIVCSNFFFIWTLFFYEIWCNAFVLHSQQHAEVKYGLSCEVPLMNMEIVDGMIKAVLVFFAI